MKEEHNTLINSYLTFKIGEELFASHVSQVINILELTKITKVPRAPEYMLGVINLRGNVLPVIDSRIKFGIDLSEHTNLTCIIVMDLQIDNSNVQVGMLVDSVQEVLEIEQKSLLPSPNIGSKFRSEFIKAMINHNDHFIMYIDVNKVFSSDELLVLKENFKVNN